MRYFKGWPGVVALISSFLSACGGGGGGSVTAAPPPPLPPPPPIAAATLDESNTGQLGGAVLQSILLARELTELLRPGVPSSVPTGGSSGPCALGGSVTTEVSADRLTMIDTFSNCAAQPGINVVTLNGRRQVVWSGPARRAAFTATVSLTDFSVAVTGGPSEETNGTVTFDGGAQDVNFESVDQFNFNLVSTSSREGTLRLQNVALNVDNSTQFLNDLFGVSGASGRVMHDAVGYADLAFDATSDKITLTGAGTGLGTIQWDFGGQVMAFQPDAQSPSTAFMQLDREEIEEIEFFNSSNRFGPLRDSTFIGDLRNVTVLKQNELTINLRSNFLDRDGDLVWLNITPGDVTIRQRSGPAETVPYDDPQVDITVEQLDAGILTVSSVTAGDNVSYQFDVIAEDASGLVSLDPLTVSFTVYLDTDGDGLADSFDRDDDEDGVIDLLDALPLDPTETEDADNDGIGDNADPDDDNDGSPDVDDAYPLDNRCYLASDGDGSRCFLSAFSFYSDVFVDRDGIAYVYYDGTSNLERLGIYRYDTTTGHFLPTIMLDPTVVGATDPLVSYRPVYVEGHHAIYVVYGDIGVSRIDLEDPALPETLFKLKEPTSTYLNLVFDYSPWVVISEQSPGIIHRRSYDESGVLIDTYDRSSATGTPIYVSPYNDQYCDEGIGLNLLDGTFFDFTNPGLLDCRINGEPQPAPDGTVARLGNTIIDPAGNVLATMVIQSTRAYRWDFNNVGVFARTQDGVEVFERDGTPVVAIDPVLPQSTGGSMSIHTSDDVAVIVENNGGLLIDRYEPPPP